ncbi:hypothetical protein F5883DRAFT_570795 [Diaporthe sp. PMI_573]|nr:hypothetical protein F5883DRAFT_570795 [Diaporthaceae sp. PMI_573]
MGITAPTVVQTIMPLALAVFEYQGTRALPKAVCFGYSSSSRNTRIPNIDQSRAFAMFFPPFGFVSTAFTPRAMPSGSTLGGWAWTARVLTPGIA